MLKPQDQKSADASISISHDAVDRTAQPGHRAFLKALVVGFGTLLFAVGHPLALAQSTGTVTSSYQQFRQELKRLGFDQYRRYAKDIYRYELDWLTEQMWLEYLNEQEQTPGFPFYHASGRMHHADGENLAEGGIPQFLDKLRVAMGHFGAREYTVSQEVEPDYVVTVNGVPYTVFTGAESRAADFNHWGVATAVTLQILNDLLETSGSHERAYSYSGGNDLHIVFLTTDMFELYQRETSIPERDKPQAMRPHGLRYFDEE
ncbi:hypothetical protein D3C72_729670 [compost metagenome]